MKNWLYEIRRGIEGVRPVAELPRKVAVELRQLGPVQNLSGLVGDDPHPDKWVFIVGCYNSGTTLLKEILGSHESVGSLPQEGVSLTDALPRPEDFGWNRLWYRCLEDVRIPPRDAEQGRAERAKRQWSPWFSQDGPVLLEKSVPNTVRIPFLQAFFRPAYFIHIVRNGYAVSEGIRRKATPKLWNPSSHREHWPIAWCAEQWCASLEVVEDDRSDVERFLEITYEDLTETPEETLGRLSEFLGIDSFPGKVSRRTWRIHGEESRIRNMNPESFERLDGDEKSCVTQVAGAKLEEYGYGPT